MKKLSIKVSSLMCRVSALGLAVLGFAACSEDSEEEMICMYGTPTGTFEIKGAVTAESDGDPVTGASIVVKRTDCNAPLAAPAASDNRGNYTVKEEKATPFDKVRVVCIPDAASGLAADSVDVNLKYKDRDKNDSWNVGKAESTVNFKLKAKPAQAD